MTNKIKSNTHYKLILRILVFIVSLFVVAFGSVVAIRSGFGGMSVFCLPYLLSSVEGSRISFGLWIIFIGLLLVLMRIVLLGKSFKRINLFSVPMVALFGWFINLSMMLTQGINPTSTILGFLIMIAGITLACLGYAIISKCRLLTTPLEGFSDSLSKVLKIDFGRVKIFFDIVLIVVSIVLMFLLWNQWRGDIVGFGTFWSVVYVGFMVRVISRRLRFFDFVYLSNNEDISLSEGVSIENTTFPIVVTIARQCGSGGHEIGEKLASRLGVKLWDKDIIDQTAERLGLEPDYVEKHEQNISTAKLLEYVVSGRSIPIEMLPSKSDALFVEQSKLIREASLQSCVIIGRCANYVLKDRPCCLNIFVRSDSDYAKVRLANRLGIDAQTAEKKLREVNRARANHYWRYTEQRWDDASHYDLVINTSKVGIDVAVEMIMQCVAQVQTV